MELRIISREIIKPSSPTPHHLKTYKLSLLDQFSPDIYFPFLYFFSGVGRSKSKISDSLKKSLSRTLTYYYPFAGRIKDDISVDCDDSGVPFVEVHVASKMSEVLKNPEMEILEQLLPFNPEEKLNIIKVNLAVQVNYFDCGGMAIGGCFRHIIADAAAAVGFVKNWATVTCDNHSDIKDVVVDCTSIFPPHELVPIMSRRVNEKQRSTKCVTKRFIFDGAKIAALVRAKISDGSSLYRPTRFEAIAALIWGVLIAMDRQSNDSTTVAILPVNLRRRVNPPLPEQCIGNIYHAGTAIWFVGETIDYHRLARNIREFTKMVNNDFIRKVYESGAFVNQFIKEGEEFVNSKTRMFGFAGPVGLPYYEVDFGWGKPTWVTTAMRLNNIAVLIESSKGERIEAWVGLPENDMAKFEQDPAILTYASFNPSLRSRI